MTRRGVSTGDPDAQEYEYYEQQRRRLEAIRWSASVESMVLELATVLTHKLKSPLTGLSLVASRMRHAGERAGGRETIKDFSNQIEAMTMRLSADVDRILEPLIGPPPDVGPIDVETIAEDAVILAKEAARRKDLEISFQAGTNLPPARGHADFLLRALHDVLVNAGEVAVPPGKIEVATHMAEAGDIEIGVTIRSLPQRRRIETLFRPPDTPPDFPILVIPRILQRIGGQARLVSSSPDTARISFHLPRGSDGPGCLI